MNTEPKHTPTPWRHNALIIWGPNDEIVADVQHLGETLKFKNPNVCPANAEFIVRAVNAHEELLDACKVMLGHYCVTGNDAFDRAEKDPIIHARAERMRAAIAKAEGR